MLPRGGLGLLLARAQQFFESAGALGRRGSMSSRLILAGIAVLGFDAACWERVVSRI